VQKIAQLMVEQLKERLRSLRITMECSQRLVEYISQKGYSNGYGARPLRKEISNTIENFLSQGIFDGKIKADDKIYLDIEDEQVVMK
jgi:ATP-dependent Clp protease ATP-binding subunit ClpC